MFGGHHKDFCLKMETIELYRATSDGNRGIIEVLSLWKVPLFGSLHATVLYLYGCAGRTKVDESKTHRCLVACD
jgi:hypothetical protein